MTLGAAWGFVSSYLLPRLPIEPLGPQASKIWMFPLWLAVMSVNKDRRAKLREFWDSFRFQKVMHSRWAKLYIEGRYATCDCSACRRNKAAIRKLLIENYLIAYCVRCRQKVSIKNPYQVVFANQRKAIGGICSICGAKVFKTGKFYGENLFKS
jgi:hypothetical protein